MSETQLDRIERRQDEIWYAIHGNGTPGLKTRIDRLERLVSGGAWVFGMIGGPTIIALFMLIIHWIRNGGRTE